MPLETLDGVGGLAGKELAKRIVEASVFAERDPYRACTHNKGIMNGVDATLIAFGQDWRAVEAGVHAYAARGGRYTALARWRVDGNALTGHMTLPLAVGTVGGVARTHPVVGVNRRIARVADASHLGRVCAAIGLAQNLAALRALAAEGIQKGHMRLHARNVAAEAGATGAEVFQVAERIGRAGTVSSADAERALAELRSAPADRSPRPDAASPIGKGRSGHAFDAPGPGPEATKPTFGNRIRHRPAFRRRRPTRRIDERAEPRKDLPRQGPRYRRGRSPWRKPRPPLARRGA